MRAESILSNLQTLKNWQKEAFSQFHGLFPSFRSHRWGYFRQDDSAYFTATLYQSLAGVAPWMTPEEKAILEEIRLGTLPGLSPFQNKQGLHRYNFWKTNPGKHFPNGYWLGRWDFFRPPDDVDDSVMIYLLQQRPWEEAKWLKQHMDSYANGIRGWVKNGPEGYEHFQAYCTFFCRDMPFGFDACVMANVLFFNRFYGIEGGFADEASLQFLVKMLENRDHVNQPVQVSPYYPKATIILYHLARLISRFQPKELMGFLDQIKQDLSTELGNPMCLAEQQMAQNAWMMLFQCLPPEPKYPVESKPFYFFVLPLSLEFEGQWARWLAMQRWTHLRFHCPALELAFSIENQVLRRKVQSPD